MQGPFDLAIVMAGRQQDCQFTLPCFEGGFVARKFAQTLGALGEFRAVEPDSERAGNTASGLDNSIVDRLLCGIQLSFG